MTQEMSSIFAGVTLIERIRTRRYSRAVSVIMVKPLKAERLSSSSGYFHILKMTHKVLRVLRMSQHSQPAITSMYPIFHQTWFDWECPLPHSGICRGRGFIGD